MEPVEELRAAYEKYRADPEFLREFSRDLSEFVGRPSPLYLAERWSRRIGFRVYLKREDLNHTGAHKINNTIGQALLAKRMGKTRIIAETGAGQHGVEVEVLVERRVDLVGRHLPQPRARPGREDRRADDAGHDRLVEQEGRLRGPQQSAAWGRGGEHL
ncbi:MAG: pyridoxal-phosphate dependent enzyme, partial [Proteobacteria bacterium]|nr:pyridoxal-phosphate dependent enzyme [Pseudomonadota bacterium]